ncbi:hypothetical protein [Ammoniphilus sp. YIM 78166]|uniref:hypothetical protein n=1 Tax=Ammoniphilus sp. YIM 78166 TaxID=1644106 RepID=UPI0010701A9F|nr:hypothetical protein [Ammoniphilus sp. YIM 78166]
MIQNIQEWVLVLLIFGITALLGNWIGYDVLPLEAIPGMIVLILICLAGLILQKLLPFSMPSVAYIGIIGILVSMPWMPGAALVDQWTTKVNLLALATPILAYAGIAIGRSWADFRKLGWKSLVVAVCVFVGTFLGSAIIAEIILRIQGII